MIFIDRKLWQVASETPIGNVDVGDIIQLRENLVPVDFYVAKHDYESSLNGAGRTLVVRKDVYDDQRWDNDNENAYARSTLNRWFNNTYKNMLDPDVQAAMGTTKFYYTPGNGKNTVGTLGRAIFALSVTELGYSHAYANTEGSALPIAATLGRSSAQWTRSPDTNNTYGVFMMGFGSVRSLSCNTSYGSCPAFTLPSDFLI